MCGMGSSIPGDFIIKIFWYGIIPLWGIFSFNGILKFPQWQIPNINLEYNVKVSVLFHERVAYSVETSDVNTKIMMFLNLMNITDFRNLRYISLVINNMFT